MLPMSDAEFPLYAGVDVGGTNIKVGLVDNAGRTISRDQIATEEARGPEDAMRRSAETLNRLVEQVDAAWDQLAAVGLGTPGSMDLPAGLILEPPNMPHWRYFPVRETLSEACGKPVAFANDANAAAYGEFWVGSGRRFDSMVMFTLGTGVGGGIILDHVPVDGTHSFGSELGHMIIDHREDARRCVWGGGQGQLEAYASAPAIVARVEERLTSGDESSLHDRLDRGEKLTTLMLAEEAEAGDDLSRQVIAETARLLGIGIVTVVHAVDPGAVVLGGAVNFGGESTQTGRSFLQRVRSEFQQRAYHIVQDTPVEFASLGSHAGYIGAAGLARALHRKGTAA